VHSVAAGACRENPNAIEPHTSIASNLDGI